MQEIFIGFALFSLLLWILLLVWVIHRFLRGPSTTMHGRARSADK